MLSPSGRSDELVALFKDPLAAHGYLLPTGTLVDSSVVQVPRQRNSREENTTLKSGEVPSDWKEQPHKLCPKDTEARWLKKKGVSHFGYKNHIAVDRAIKLITNWEVSPAHVHDSQVFEVLLDAVVFHNNPIPIFHIISTVVRQIFARYSNFFTLFRPGATFSLSRSFLMSSIDLMSVLCLSRHSTLLVRWRWDTFHRQGRFVPAL